MNNPKFHTLNNAKRIPVYEKIDRAKEFDIRWMLSIECNPDKNTPMWVGWNSKFNRGEDAIQIVWYMKQINASPTAKSVVAETMRRTLPIEHECNRDTIAVTYDLAIAKIAMQIQQTESPKYDKLFICLGAFHIGMAFFLHLVRLLQILVHILNESEVLAQGQKLQSMPASSCPFGCLATMSAF